MPTQPPPQPSAAELSAKPAQPSVDASPSGPDAAAKPVQEGALFHLLVERGWDAALAYTADQRIHAMTSEIAAAGLKPVLAELARIRETMAGFATKKELQTELRQIRESMVTKTDLADFVTREDLKATLADFPTKADLRHELAEFRTDLRRELAERETRLVKWVFGALLAQTAVIVGLVTLLR